MLDTQPLQALLHGLLDESARQDPLPVDTAQQRKLLRTLMNVRPPKPIDKNLLLLQDHILQDELSHKTVTEADSLPPSALDLRLCLWQGDITTLRCDAVVNAANPALLGCFNPLHNCIDNVIHSASGIQLRLACHAQMEKQGHDEPAGHAKLTLGFNLPARFVLHTVGPVARDGVTAEHRATLASCYRSCLELAEKHSLGTIAFCGISTGVYGFPTAQAAPIAVETVRTTLPNCPHIRRVIFNVFTDSDWSIYHHLLF